MKTIITSLLFISTFVLQAQNKSSKIDIRIGAGIIPSSSLNAPHVIQNEINYKLNNYLTVSAGLSFGKNEGGNYSESYQQWNLNGFFSPLKNNKKHDIRIGGGLSSMSYTSITADGYIRTNNQTTTSINNVFGNDDIAIIGETKSAKNLLGYNSIIEYNYKLNSRFLTGIVYQLQNFPDGRYRDLYLLKIGLAL